MVWLASLCTHCRRRRLSPSTMYCHSLNNAEVPALQAEIPVCFSPRAALKKCLQLAGEAADARAARPTDSPPPMKSQRLRFLPSGSGGPIQRSEDRINCDVVDGGGEATEQSFPDHMQTSTTPGEAATASVPPAPENATKEEVMQAFKSVLMEVADKTGEKVANALIKLLRHESLDTSFLRDSI
jgi:hypothetical protein